MNPTDVDYFKPEDMQVKIFADGADPDSMARLAQEKWVKGFTTNPTLMRAIGVTSYPDFAKKVLSVTHEKPVSFEVFSDHPDKMLQQALTIKTWGEHAIIKIPITTTQGEFMGPLIQELQSLGVPLNITAVFTVEQVHELLKYLKKGREVIVSVFAGRIADTGRDPMTIMAAMRRLLVSAPHVQLLWASCREVYNILQAEQAGCQIITVTHDILKKMHLLGKDLAVYSLETVRQFYEDARVAGFTLAIAPEALVDQKTKRRLR